MHQDADDEVITIFYDKSTKGWPSESLETARMEFFEWIRESPSRLGVEYTTADGRLVFAPLSRNRYRLCLKSRVGTREAVNR